MTAVGLHPEDLRAAAQHAAARARLTARSVALVGFMGVGKSSVGQALARLLERPFLDTDEMVETASGRSIPELFAQGEAAFRRWELDALRQALARPAGIIALGGGTFSQPECARLLLAEALTVHVYVPWKTLRGELNALATDRPLLQERTPAQVHDLFLSRTASYRQAHLRVRVPRTGAEAAANSIAVVLRSYRWTGAVEGSGDQ